MKRHLLIDLSPVANPLKILVHLKIGLKDNQFVLRPGSPKKSTTEVFIKLLNELR